MDKLELYRWAVQDPETHAEVLRIMYLTQNPGHSPVIIREDFAGTAADSVAWVALRDGRRTIAVDIDEPTVAWAKNRAERILGSRADQIDFYVSDVMEVAPPRVPPADIISVLNYSLFYFHDRESLLAYFVHARQCLAPQGILVCNLFGGPKAQTTHSRTREVIPAPRMSSERPVAPFEYTWEQTALGDLPARLDCRIHFSAPNPESPGEIVELRNSFQYDFRVWQIEELIDMMRESAFDDVEVWRHTYDPEKGPESLFLGPVPLSDLSTLDYWTAYVLASC